MEIISEQQTMKCKKHKKKDIRFLQVNELEDDKSIFYCGSCFDDDFEFKQSNYVSVENIISSSNDSIISKWPPLSDIKISQQILQAASNNQVDDQLCEKIYSFFEDLKKECIQKITDCQKKMVNLAEKYPKNGNEFLLQTYTKIAKTEELKELLSDNSRGTTSTEKSCREFINSFQKNKTNNTQQLLTALDKDQQIAKNINFSQPNTIKKAILSMIDQISFFNFDLIAEDINNLDQVMQMQMRPIQNLLPDMQFIASTFEIKDCSKLDIQKKENHAIDIIAKKGLLSGNVHSNIILNRDTKYVFRFSIHIDQFQEQNFLIGLVRDSTKNLDHIVKDKLSCFLCFKNNSVFSQNNVNYGVNKIQKGDFSKLTELKEVEIRICINEGILEVLDYPSYDHKLGISDEFKNNLLNYQDLRIAAYLYGDIKVTLISAFTTNEFIN